MGLIQPKIERGRNLLGPNFFYFASFCVQKFQLCLFPHKKLTWMPHLSLLSIPELGADESKGGVNKPDIEGIECV